MRTLPLANGERTVPVLGLGTARLGDSKAARDDEVRAVGHALQLGYRLIDTAEMYGAGGAEEVVGAALAASGLARDAVFVVSKVYPHHASRAGVQAACRRSLQRLGLTHIDLYLLHWRGGAPLAETVAGFEDLRRDGLSRDWGVSNFDLLPWLRAHGVAAMAHSPIDQGPLAQSGPLQSLARPLGLTAAQLALAWVLRQPGVVAVAKAAHRAHQRDNLAAAEVALPAPLLAELDRRYPPPRHKQPLALT